MHHHVALRISEEEEGTHVSLRHACVISEEGTHVSLQVHDRQLYDLKSTMHKLYTIRRALHPDMIF